MNKILIEWIIRGVLSIVFLVSAYSKLIAPGLIEIILVDQGFASSRESVAVYVRLLIAVEFSLGLLFLQQNYLKQIVVPASILFLAGFTAYLAYTGFVLGETDNCGCFGEMLKLSPVESIIKNIVLLIPAVVLLSLLNDTKRNITFPIVVFLLSIAAVFIISPVKQEKDFQFSQYTSFEGSGRVDLSSGDKLLAVFNTECEHCQESAKELYQLRKQNKIPELYILFFTEGSVSVDSFKSITTSNFPYRTIQVNEFFNLIGQSPPRVYWLQNGVVKEKWDDEITAKIKSKFSIK